MIIRLDECTDTASLCLKGLTPELVSGYELLRNGQPWPEGLEVCDYDTLSIYFYGLLFGQGVLGPYRLDAWQVDSDTFTGNFPTISALVDSMNTWDPLGDWELQPATFTITGGQKGRAYGAMSVTALVINSPGQIGYNYSLKASAWGVRPDRGVYNLALRHSASGEIFTSLVVAGCNGFAAEDLVLMTGESWTFCLPDSILWGNIVHIQGDTLPGAPVSFDWKPGPACLEVTARYPGTISRTVVWTDAYGYSFTLQLNVRVILPEDAVVIPLSIYAGETLLYCPDTVGLSGSLVSVQDACPQSGLPAFQMEALGLCYRINGLVPADTAYACLIRCDDTGYCDTIYLQVTVLFHLERQDTAHSLVRFQRWWCPDITVFEGSVLAFTESCPSMSGLLDYSLDPMGPCVQFTGLAPGTDTLCLELEDEKGNRLSIILAITITSPRPDTLTLQMMPGEARVVCLDSSELAGTPQTPELSCGGWPSTLAEMTPLAPPCLRILALAPGQGQACLLVCDTFGTCDTTYLLLEILDPALGEFPIARDDTASATQGQTLVIPVLLNDEFNAQHPQFLMSLVQAPLQGQVLLNADGTFTYQPASGHCGEDMFFYRICHGAICDSAAVLLRIRCPEDGRLEVFSGFSPNGDGVNDFFTIRGIEEYPENRLRIYNRWGNLVLDRAGYQNNWDGTWDGTLLPDGTYYYLLTRPNGPTQSGWLQLWR